MPEPARPARARPSRFLSRRQLGAGPIEALPCAESEHASGGVLAAPLLTIGPKRKSAALSAGFSNVAIGAVLTRLLL